MRIKLTLKALSYFLFGKRRAKNKETHHLSCYTFVFVLIAMGLTMLAMGLIASRKTSPRESGVPIGDGFDVVDLELRFPSSTLLLESLVSAMFFLVLDKL